VKLGSASEEKRIKDRIEELVGGTVTGLGRESRWRPSWIASVRKDGTEMPIYVRGDRESGRSFPLSYESTVMQVLEENGIPVPHVYGMCTDPEAIIMDMVPGARQMSGLSTDDEKRSVIDQYIAITAKMHQIDVEKFEKRGLANPLDATELQQNYHHKKVEFYRAIKSRPEPFVEFILKWMDLNVPRHRTQRSFVACDAGQFLVERGRVSALYDFEMAHINDPLVDLGGWRVRNVFEPLYDLGYMYRQYANLTGTELDFDVINYHVMVLAIATSLTIAKQITVPLDTAVNWLLWEVSGSRITISAMADILDVELKAPEPPPPTRSPRSHAAESMKLAINAIPTDPNDPSTNYQRAMALNLAAHLELVDRFGVAIDNINLDEIEALVGYRPSTSSEADAALEKFVLSAGPEYDTELLQLFFRRNERNRMLLPVFTEAVAAGDIGPYLENAYLPRLRDVLDSDGRATLIQGSKAHPGNEPISSGEG